MQLAVTRDVEATTDLTWDSNGTVQWITHFLM